MLFTRAGHSVRLFLRPLFLEKFYEATSLVHVEMEDHQNNGKQKTEQNRKHIR